MKSASSYPALTQEVSRIRRADNQAAKLRHIEQAGAILGKLKYRWEDGVYQFAKDWLADVGEAEGLDADEVTEHLARGIAHGEALALPKDVHRGSSGGKEYFYFQRRR